MLIIMMMMMMCQVTWNDDDDDDVLGDLGGEQLLPEPRHPRVRDHGVPGGAGGLGGGGGAPRTLPHICGALATDRRHRGDPGHGPGG